MQIRCTYGTFTAAAVAGHPEAIELRADVPAELTELGRALLPDMVVTTDDSGARAVVARDEWAHALELLVRRL